MKLFFFLLFFILFLITLNFKETYKNFRNIFWEKSNIFENKTIFLIANNPNLSEKTQKFLNDYDYKNSLIVRFNGYKKKVKDYCKGKTDIMVYRKKSSFPTGFHGYNKESYNKNIINLFTKDFDKGEDEFAKYYYINEKQKKRYEDLQSSYTLAERYSFKELNYPKKF